MIITKNYTTQNKASQAALVLGSLYTLNYISLRGTELRVCKTLNSNELSTLLQAGFCIVTGAPEKECPDNSSWRLHSLRKFFSHEPLI